jgi:lipopolysaccharide export system protein LptA
VQTRRRWQIAIAATILLLIAISAGFYTYAKRRARAAIRRIPEKLGINISQQAEGFTFSKSQGGHTLFTVKAGKVVQFKGTQSAQLQNVSITVFGRDGSRYDQISGEQFSYDQKAGEVRADGPVSIDLQGNPDIKRTGDQAPPEEIRNPVHLRTSGLVFSQKTGIAQTPNEIELRAAQADGSARGVVYDSNSGIARFEHDVRLTTHTATPQTVTASSLVYDAPALTAHLIGVTLKDKSRTTTAPALEITMRDNNSIERVVANSGFATHSAADQNSLSAHNAVFRAAGKNDIQEADFSGDVQISAQNTSSHSDSAQFHFGARNTLRSADLKGSASVRQQSGSELRSEAIHLDLRPNQTLDRATTSSPAAITVVEPDAERTTNITGDHLDATFDRDNHLQRLHVAPNVHVVSKQPETPDRTTTAQTLDASFNLQNGKTALASLVQSGNVVLSEAARHATAQKAEYSPATHQVLLTGTPLVSDTGMSIAASTIQFDQQTGAAHANGDVRITYSDSTAPAAKTPEPNTPAAKTANTKATRKPAPEPLHALASSAQVQRVRDNLQLSLSGSPARLWQAGNVIQAPSINFDRNARTFRARAGDTPVTTTFVQVDRSGRTTPVTVTAAKLDYSDAKRRADFDGNVTARAADGTISAQHLTVVLSKPGTNALNQLDQIIASGDVRLNQGDRRGTGDRLSYTANDAKFVLTGSPEKLPSIFDAEHGQVTGDSLTFYSRDDRVLVESHGKQTVTTTHLNQAK